MKLPPRPNTLRQELEESLDEAEWSWIAPHLVRDALVLVSNELDLLVAAEMVARDEQVQVGQWVREGLVSKPSQAQIEAWTKSPTKKFLSVIVQPFVLIQEHFVN